MKAGKPAIHHLVRVMDLHQHEPRTAQRQDPFEEKVWRFDTFSRKCGSSENAGLSCDQTGREQYLSMADEMKKYAHKAHAGQG